MRVFYGLVLLMAATSVSGCVSNTLNGLSNLSTNCTVGATSVSCIAPTGTGTGTGTGPTTTTTTGTTTTTTTTVNTGNTATFTIGDTTLILEGSTVQSLVGKPVGLSQLIDSPLNHVAVNQTADQKIAINTNTANNGNWPVAKTMTYSEFGTCTNDGGVDPLNPGKCFGGTGGHGLGGDYKLYRYYQKGGFDEELQIWTWNQSYATQYRDVTASGTDPQHQAWSFGGNYTPAANVPIAGIVNYAGQWGATAKTSNFVDLAHPYVLGPGVVPVTGIGKTMSYNNNWRVQGTSALTANFSTMGFSGTLTPLFWQGVDQNLGLSTVDVANAVANNAACQTGSGACNVQTFAGAAVFNNWQNFNAAYMTSNVKLQGTITKDATNVAKPNQIAGTASMDPAKGWTTTVGSNPMYGGFFGNAAQEVTGAFGLDAVIAGPNDGFYPINNDRRAFIQMSGIFHGQ